MAHLLVLGLQEAEVAAAAEAPAQAEAAVEPCAADCPKTKEGESLLVVSCCPMNCQWISMDCMCLHRGLSVTALWRKGSYLLEGRQTAAFISAFCSLGVSACCALRVDWNVRDVPEELCL